MEWIQAKVILDCKESRLAVDLVYSVFYDMGIRSVVIEEPGNDPAEGWGKDAVEPEAFSVTGYIQKDEYMEQKCLIMEAKLSSLKKRNGIFFKIVYSPVRETDWAESWKRYFKTTKIGSRIVVKPTWRRYFPKPGEIILELDPGMAFGTGGHPTTAMCIEIMEDFLNKGDRLLDVGSGSGILMLAAAKLGARYVLGIDNDEPTLHIAKKNLLQNQITSFDVTKSNLVNAVKGKFDIVVANILSKVIIDLLGDIKNVLSEKGMFICSGILDESRMSVIEKMKAVGFENIRTLRKEYWVAIAGSLI